MITQAVLFRDFIGREKELEIIVTRFRDAAARGRGAAFVVRGRAGLGKTRLTTEFLRRSGRTRARLVTAKASGGGRRPFGFLEQVVDGLESSGAPALSLGARRVREGIRQPISPEASKAEADRRAREIAEEFGAAALRCGALAIVLDDVHAADRASLDVIRALGEVCERAPLVVLATLRTDREEVDEERTDALALTNFNYHAIDLEPLSRSALSGPLRQLLGSRRDLAERLLDLSEGNPYAAEELARATLEAENVEAIDLPRAFTAAVRLRFETLDDAAQAVVLHAALLGGPFSLERLAGIVSHDARVVARAIDAAIALQLIDDIGGTYRFRHALTRECLARTLLHSQAAAMHRAIAERFAADTEDRLTERAYHLWAARDRIDGVRLNEAAGDRDVVVGAMSDASENYRRAIDLRPQQSDDLKRISEKLLECYWGMGDFEGAEAVAGRAADEFRALGLDDDADRFGLRYAAQAFACGSLARATRFAQEIRIRRGGDAVGIAASIALAQFSLFSGDIAAAGTMLASIVDNDLTARQRCIVLALRAQLAAYERDYAGAFAHARAAVDQGNVIDDFSALDIATSALAGIHMEVGELRCALDHYRAIYASATERGLDRIALTARANIAACLFQLGQLDESRAFVLRSRYGTHLARGRMLALEIALSALQGNARDAKRDDIEFRAAVERGLPAEIAALAGAFLAAPLDEARARAVIAAALPFAFPGLRSFAFFDGVIRHGDDATAMVALDRLEYVAAPSEQRLGRAYLALGRARLALRRQRHDESREHAAAAARAFAELERPVEHARSLVLAGDENGARAIFGEIGAKGELARLSGGPHVESDPATSLSAREREVARRLARGTSVREVADELGIAFRTVEKHASNIYRKLGIATRLELAAHLETAE